MYRSYILGLIERLTTPEKLGDITKIKDLEFPVSYHFRGAAGETHLNGLSFSSKELSATNLKYENEVGFLENF